MNLHNTNILLSLVTKASVSLPNTGEGYRPDPFHIRSYKSKTLKSYATFVKAL